jgi:transposase
LGCERADPNYFCARHTTVRLGGFSASAVNAKGGFWCATYKGGMNAELFIALLKAMMFRRKKPVLLILDSLPAHKAKIVKDYVASTEGKLEFHFLPGYAPELNPDEMVWNYMKRTGTARKPLAKGDCTIGSTSSCNKFKRTALSFGLFSEQKLFPVSVTD